MGMNANMNNESPLARRSVSRRSLMLGLVVSPVVAALLAACGDPDQESADTVAPTTVSPTTQVPTTQVPTTQVPTTDSPATDSPITGPSTDVGNGIEHPTAADEAVIRIQYEGGFVPPGVDFAQLPTLLIAGDGRVYQQGVTTEEFPGALVRPVTVRPLSEAGLQRLLELAEDAGLLAGTPDYTGAGNIADAPDTVVTIKAAGGTYVHRAYALDLDDPSSGESSPARDALREFVEKATDLAATVGEDQLGEETSYEPDSYRMRSLPVQEGDLAGQDPEPTRVSWPDSADVLLRDATDCAVLDADVIGELFAESKQNTVFTEGDGETASLYQLAVVPVLPGDPGC
jgi:hypothetical protein